MSEQTTHITDVRRLQRSREDRIIAGVCGGLARYFEIHPAVFRVGFVVLTLLGGAGVLIYAAAAVVIPDEGKEDSVATAAIKTRRDRPWPLIGLGLVAIAGAMLLSRATFWPHGDAWVLLLVAGAIILWVTRHGAPTPAEPAEPAEPDAPATVVPHRRRRTLRGLGIALGSLVAIVLVGAAAFAAAFHVHLGRGVGDETYVVTRAQDVRSEYRLGVGELRLDLHDVTLPAGETHVTASVDVGSLRIGVPDDVALRVHADAQLGRIVVPHQVVEGHDVSSSVVQSGERVLVLDAHVGAGAIQVTRATVR
jgi:phage shock protein PspC (stress-responsive transcriptional regulator)